MSLKSYFRCLFLHLSWKHIFKMVLRKQNHTKNQEISRLRLLGKINIFSAVGLSMRSLVQVDELSV